MHTIRVSFLLALCVLAVSVPRYPVTASDAVRSETLLRRINLETQPKVVKIFGVGGLRQLEAYQTGFFISPEGHILTTQSLVLDEGEVTVVLWNGTRATGEVVAVDPLLELALLKLDLEEPTSFFSLEMVDELKPGARILALANVFGIAVYDEPVSVLQGVITSKVPLSARRGAFDANYSGDVYVVDAATNNPGAAGGAVIDLTGQLVGMIGKELKSEATGTWLNYALPASALKEPVERMVSGEAPLPPKPLEFVNDQLTLGEWGIVLVPDVVDRTPPFVERLVVDSAAAKAGLRADDLIVAVNERTVASQRELSQLIARAPGDQPLQLTVLRDRALVQVSLEREGDNAQ